MIKNNDLILASDRVILREFMEHDWADVHQYASQEIVVNIKYGGRIQMRILKSLFMKYWKKQS